MVLTHRHILYSIERSWPVAASRQPLLNTVFLTFYVNTTNIEWKFECLNYQDFNTSFSKKDYLTVKLRKVTHKTTHFQCLAGLIGKLSWYEFNIIWLLNKLSVCLPSDLFLCGAILELFHFSARRFWIIVGCHIGLCLSKQLYSHQSPYSL